MTLNSYQKQASDTAVYPRKGVLGGLYYTILGLTGEAGEVSNKAKKILRDFNGQINDENKEDMVSELGDVLWYASMIAFELGIKLDEVANKNILKLQDRMKRDKIKGSGDKR